MTLIMAKYHHNVYAIEVNCFSFALDLLKEFYKDSCPKFPRFVDHAASLFDLKFITAIFPENCCYMVLRSRDGFDVWLLPTSSSVSGINHLIDNGAINIDHCTRDVGFYDLRDTINDLPYNWHYIVLRYYC